MSNYDLGEDRRRHRCLLVVEGNHEKNVLFQLVFQCFPELSISMDDVWIYGTNIYMLYAKLETEYGSDWENVDIDLPFVLTNNDSSVETMYKEDFTSIFLVFDYERHDPNFSEQKILRLQSYFTDEADVGKLYINYPMIESYQHFKKIPDDNYRDKKISVTLQPGSEYKNFIRKPGESAVVKWIDFYEKVPDILEKRYYISDNMICKQCVEYIMGMKELSSETVNRLKIFLKAHIDEAEVATAVYLFKDWIERVGYTRKGLNYFEFMRGNFIQIIKQNISKAYMIQYNNYDVSEAIFKDLNLKEILMKQNKCSEDEENGYIWVLNTCLFLIPDFNLSLLMDI
ncbi:MAG: hypothetical protein IJN64_03175 [Lachnospiraceae bacterium]|nr:hypothetical protein [Lachnospiraceae bacterium]